MRARPQSANGLRARVQCVDKHSFTRPSAPNNDNNVDPDNDVVVAFVGARVRMLSNNGVFGVKRVGGTHTLKSNRKRKNSFGQSFSDILARVRPQLRVTPPWCAPPDKAAFDAWSGIGFAERVRTRVRNCAVLPRC